MSEPLLDGVTIRLGRQDYVLPPLNLDALEKHLEMIQGWAVPPDSIVQRLGEVATVVHAALKRNYPDLDLSEVKAGLDLQNFGPIVTALLESSGLAETEPGESPAEGVPTGPTLEPASPASPAGPGNTSAKP